MADTKPCDGARGVPAPEDLTVIEVHPTAHLSEEQRAWRVVELTPGREPTADEARRLFGATRGRSPQPPSPRTPLTPPQDILPAVARMLTEGGETDAPAVFARLRAAGVALKAVIGDDGALRVTVVGA